MISSVNIHGFRGFSELKLPGLKRFNLFVGRNNVGKTSVLEAIFALLGAASPDIPVRMHAWRRGSQEVPAGDLAAWLFHDGNTASPIELSCKDAKGSHRLRILMTEPRLVLSSGKHGSASQMTDVFVPHYEFISKSRGNFSLAPEFDGNAVTYPRRKGPFAASVFLTRRYWNISEDAKRFQMLEEQKGEDEAVAFLRALEPNLKRLSVYQRPSGDLALRADIGAPRLVPIEYLGEGTVVLARLVLALLSNPGGCLLVDEIESGLHYDAMKSVWSALMGHAATTDVQVFAATHSLECVEAAHRAASERLEYELAVYRLDRTNGKVKAFHFDQEDINTAITCGLEVR